MSQRLAIALTLATLTLVGCSDGEDARSTTEGKAPYNAPAGETGLPSGTATGTDTATTEEAATATTTDTGTGTATEGVSCQAGEEDDKGEVFTNNINFSAVCKSFYFTSPGKVVAVVRGNADASAQVTVALDWTSGDDTTIPVTGKVYTEQEKNGTGQILARARLDVDAASSNSYYAKTSKITFVKLPLTPGSEYEVTFDFSVEDIPDYPSKTVTFSGTAKGTRPP